ncbi:unnamed protein product [Brassica rapa subsp. trilocularis]
MVKRREIAREDDWFGPSILSPAISPSSTHNKHESNIPPMFPMSLSYSIQETSIIMTAGGKIQTAVAAAAMGRRQTAVEAAEGRRQTAAVAAVGRW